MSNFLNKSIRLPQPQHMLRQMQRLRGLRNPLWVKILSDISMIGNPIKSKIVSVSE